MIESTLAGDAVTLRPHMQSEDTGGQELQHERKRLRKTKQNASASTTATRRRERHLKCDTSTIPCPRCEAEGTRCDRVRKSIKFRHGSSARYDSGFASDQIWLNIPSKAVKYIDETAYIGAGSAEEGNVIEDSDSDDSYVYQEEGFQTGIRPIGAVSLSTTALRSEENNDSDNPREEQRYVSPRPYDPEHENTLSLQISNGSAEILENRILTSHSTTYRSDPFIHHVVVGGSSPAVQASNNSIPGPLHTSRGSFSASGVSPVSSRFAWYSPTGIGSRSVEHRPNKGLFLPDLIKKPAQGTDIHSDSARVRACLLRYFIENLASWFDLCDPESYFGRVVPCRARSSPPLMNAILTASARHLTRLARYKNSEGVIEWRGQLLPDLKVDMALHYHNECIKDLLDLSMDPQQLHNEDLLAAAVILRFYEEVDISLRQDEDEELFLRVINMFISAQAPSTPQSNNEVIRNVHSERDGHISATSPTASGLHGSSEASMASPNNGRSIGSYNNPSTTVPRRQVPHHADTLRQASIWVAFRQEIHTTLIKQRPFSFPLHHCDETFRQYTPADDTVWADRLIVFCADVCEFCYGSSSISASTPSNNPSPLSPIDTSSTHSRDRWHELKHREQTWPSVLPSTFSPIYFREPNSEAGEVFPEIWYLSPCHVTGIQHVELARLLLAVFDPTRPKLGPGYLASMKNVAITLRATVLRLCGIARSNPLTAPGLVTAFLGIAMCGEYFESRPEQEALADMLSELEQERAWPTEKIANSLKRAWGWYS